MSISSSDHQITHPPKVDSSESCSEYERPHTIAAALTRSVAAVPLTLSACLTLNFHQAFAPRSRIQVTTSCRQQRTFIPSCGRWRRNEPEVIDAESLKKAGEEGVVRQPQLYSGRLGPSIFDSLEEKKPSGSGSKSVVAAAERKQAPTWKVSDWRELRPSVKDPRPKARIRWQRKIVIRDVRGRHRLNKTEKLLRTERFHLAKSPFVKTSIKKLGPLARQIAGKPLDEALLQMRFSKKKAAKDVLKHLKYARDQAIVEKGLGLGRDIAPAVPRAEGEEAVAKPADQGIVIRDNKGRRRIITDPGAVYVDQAWVGRGSYGFGVDYRARGRSNRLRLPWTSKSLTS